VLSRLPDREKKLVFLASIQEAKFRKPVIPGDQLRIEANFLRLKPSVAKIHCIATVSDVVVAEADLICSLIDKP